MITTKGTNDKRLAPDNKAQQKGYEMSEQKEVFRPVTAITMGDPASIGPEIVVGTMLDPSIIECCKPFVIGDAVILERAAKVLGKDIKIHKISDPDEALYEYGTIDILETGEYDTDSIKWGEVQALAGQMSYDWIMKSIELGLAGKVDAVSTSPINKQAIKLVGVKEPGHTEIYQNATNSPYALTMFSCHKLRVFFVSRHMSLIDAVHYATKDVVLEFLRNINYELKSVGIENPLIAVAGINPHNGDNGLFGREEIDELFPAVEAAQAEGINAIGPIPGDSIFNIGKSGKFDAILSMYHDQGHIACKTLDFEKSVTITWGLPFIRGSVDHGTAFDIAGKGIAGCISLIESTKVCVEYAVKKHEGASK